MRELCIIIYLGASIRFFKFLRRNNEFKDHMVKGLPEIDINNIHKCCYTPRAISFKSRFYSSRLPHPSSRNTLLLRSRYRHRCDTYHSELAVGRLPTNETKFTIYFVKSVERFNEAIITTITYLFCFLLLFHKRI